MTCVLCEVVAGLGAPQSGLVVGMSGCEEGAVVGGNVRVGR